MCAWEGVKEMLAVVGEKVRMECKVLASPPDVMFTWERVTFTANMTQVSWSWLEFADNKRMDSFMLGTYFVVLICPCKSHSH